MADDLYVYIITVPSKLDKFQKGRNHHKWEDKPNPQGDPVIPEVGGQTKPPPKLGPKKDEQDKQAESHFKDDLCHGAWSQPGTPSESPRSCGKFVRNSTSLAKEKYTQHRKFSHRGAPFWIKNKSFLYNSDKRECRTSLLQVANRCS